MRARELAEPFPTVRPDTSALDAARLLVERRLHGLIVVDDAGHPCAVLSGSRLLRYVIPQYVQEDPTLARVYDEKHADRILSRLADMTAGDFLTDDRKPVPIIDGDATVIEIAALMAVTHSPLIAVVDDPADRLSPLIGAITADRLFARLLEADSSPSSR